MNISTILPLLSAIFICILGFMVFFKGGKNKLNLTFSLFALLITIWMFGTFMMFLFKDDPDTVIFWDKVVYAGVAFIPAVMYHFGATLTNNKIIKNNFLIIFGYILSSIFFLLIPTDLFVDGAFIYKWGAHSKAQLFHHIFLIYFFIYLTLWYSIVYKYFKSLASPFEKQRIKYCFLAYLEFTFGLFAFLPAYGIAIYPFGYFSGVIFVIILAYAIVRHRLMDIKVVLRKSTVYISSLLTILIPAVSIRYFINHNYASLLTFSDFAILIISLAVFAPVRSFYYRLANKYFFTSLYDSKTVIGQLSNSLRTTLNVDKIYKIIDETLINAFHAKAIGFVRYDKTNCDYHMSYNNGFDNKGQKEFPGNRLLHETYIAKDRSIIVEDLKNSPDQNYAATLRMLSALKIEILAPLNIKDKTIGLVAIGQKETGDMYNDEDISMLEIISSQAAIALENASLYEKTKRFNIKLKKEIAKATEDLVLANEQLKKLDQAKSEFISIASHQLRTPLTVVKGYVSMILERNFGEIGEKQVEPLEKVYLSNERLIQLVENLLNVSRIESGRLQFSYTEFQLEDMVDSVVEELSNYAKKKGLKLIWDRPASPLPKVYIDEEKIRQVVMNLTDNAIKYTKQGSVTVTLKQIDDNLQFCVSDSGMGILATDLPNLFQKFSRGTGTSLVHTEGTGLGLYVARQMIEAHKGKIWAESEGEYKGSRFYFTIPIIK